jgi:hydroxymethylbilane synthase
LSPQCFQTVTVGSRGSDLALWQTRWVIARLQQVRRDVEFRIQRITTRGDVVRDRALSQVGGKGLFVKEIETALLIGEIDLAVHSLKDMPTELPEGLTISAVTARPAACGGRHNCGLSAPTCKSLICGATWTPGCARP